MKKTILALMIGFCLAAFYGCGPAVSKDMPTPIPFIYALQKVKAEDLARYRPQVVVVDPEDSGIKPRKDLPNSSKFAYISIGEAEDYREYWQEVQGWNIVLNENPQWHGNFPVKYWDDRWQALTIQRIKALAEQGWDGAYMDIVDAYQVEEVKAAYRGSTSPRAEMEAFVIKLSQAAKAVNPNFRMIPQNALGLVLEEDGIHPNRDYLDAIDGIGTESLFYVDDAPSPYPYDVTLAMRAKKEGKFILATSYPTREDYREDFVNKATAEGFWTFIGRRALDGTFRHIKANHTIHQKMKAAGHALKQP
jgi:cysteinyl-tRNA synthetase